MICLCWKFWKIYFPLISLWFYHLKFYFIHLFIFILQKYENSSYLNISKNIYFIHSLAEIIFDRFIWFFVCWFHSDIFECFHFGTIRGFFIFVFIFIFLINFIFLLKFQVLLPFLFIFLFRVFEGTINSLYFWLFLFDNLYFCFHHFQNRFSAFFQSHYFHRDCWIWWD